VPLALLFRAYKLGKKRWSYNQVELQLSEAGGERQASIKQTAHAADVQFPEASQVQSLRTTACFCASTKSSFCTLASAKYGS
jgi:hypothetical protein